MTTKITMDTLYRSLQRNDYMAINNGIFEIKLSSNKPVKIDHQRELIKLILQSMGINAFYYTKYSTGNYGKNKRPGITLQFESELSDITPHCIFNVELTRKRNTQHGKAERPLPSKRFRPLKGSRFCKFWKSTGLTIPPHNAYYDYMGNLKRFLFTFDVNEINRVTDKDIKLLNITHEEILKKLNIEPVTNNKQIKAIQDTYNSHITLPNKELTASHILQGLEPNLTTCENNYEQSKQVSTLIGNSYIPNTVVKRVEEQSNDEWLSSYADYKPTPARY
jgi:hypothetical protein